MRELSAVIRWVRRAALIGIAGLLLGAHRMGLLRAFGDPGAARATLLALGGWGQLGFVGAYTLLQPFGVPGTVFVMAAPLVWPWPVAFALSMIGTMTASVVGFSFARFVGREWVASKSPVWLARYEVALQRRAFTTVFLLRLVFWMPQWLHVFLGVSGVPFWTHFWASLAGYAPPLFLVSFFGQELFDWMRAAPLWVWVVTGAVVVAIGASVWVRGRTDQARERPDKAPPIILP